MGLVPSSDTAAHAYVYRHMPRVGGIVETLSGSPSPVVLMADHGPFTIGRDARAAVKAARSEEVARTVRVARAGGRPVAIPRDVVDSLNDRCRNVYGQH